MADNILVLEDQPAWQALVTSAVRNGRLPDCNLHVVQTYAEATQLLQKVPFRVGLLDYALARSGPEGAKTGLDVAAELRRVSPGAKILLVTMVDPERINHRCEELNIVLIEKGRPDLEQEILREVRHALSSTPPPP